MHRMLLPIALILTSSACHTFQPASVGDLTPGETVRVRVTGAFSDSLSSILAVDDARTFEGVVASGGASSLFLDVPVQQELVGMRFQTLNQRVEVPSTAFVEVETKKLDRQRTVLAAGIATAVVATVVVVQLNKRSGGNTLPGPGGGPVDAIVSLESPWRAIVGLLGW